MQSWPPPSEKPIEFPFGDATFIDLLETKMPHPLQRAVMPIVLERNGSPQIVGTAFAIGSGIALTAAHTLIDGGQLRGTDPGVLYVGGTSEDGQLLGVCSRFAE